MPHTAHAPIEQRQARKGLAIYLTLVIVCTAPILTAVIWSGHRVEDPAVLPYMIALMWVPALASMIARLVLREGFGGVSFRLGGKAGVRAVGVALLLPAVVGLLAYGAAWMTGLARFVPPAGGWYAGMEPGALRFTLAVITATLVGGLVGIITAAGEEIGWRGYLLPRLVQAGAPWPLVTSGLIWGLWHVPGILTGQYASGASPLLSAVVFMVFAVGMSACWGALRLRTGSVWSAIIGHAAWNAVIEGPFTSYTAGSASTLWLGESGLLVALVVSVAGTIIWRWVRGDVRSVSHTAP